MMLAARGEAAMSRQRRMPGVPARTSSVENRRGRLLLLGHRAGFIRAISLTAPHRLAVQQLPLLVSVLDPSRRGRQAFSDRTERSPPAPRTSRMAGVAQLMGVGSVFAFISWAAELVWAPFPFSQRVGW